MKERYVIAIEVIGAGCIFGSLVYEFGLYTTAIVITGVLLIMGAQLVRTR